MDKYIFSWNFFIVPYQITVVPTFANKNKKQP